MAGTANPVGTSNPSNIWLQGLVGDTRWSSGGGTTTISVHIAATGGARNLTIDPNDPFDSIWAYKPFQEEIGAMRAAMAAIEAVCNIDFQEVGSVAGADLIFAMVGDEDSDFDGAGPEEPVGGWANFPGDVFNPAVGDEQSQVTVNADGYDFGRDDPEFLARGGFDFTLFLHELGHALGLAHPHDPGNGSTVFPGVSGPFNFGDWDMNQGIFTMMSYNHGWQTGPQGGSPSSAFGYEAGPMALDIAALQYLYGANTSYRTGDNLYQLPGSNQIGTGYRCLWDASGTDRIQGAANRENEIDLRAATLAWNEGAGGWVSYAEGVHGGFTIARGTVIENATGGSQHDEIYGNSARNRLEGLGSWDVLVGRGGDDRLFGGGGGDDLFGGAGFDRMTGGAGADWFFFGRASDSVPGTRADEIFDFGTGADRIILTDVDANGSWAGNGTFRLDTNGDFRRGEIRQFTDSGDLWIEMNTDGDAAAEMAIYLWNRTTALSETQFEL